MALHPTGLGKGLGALIRETRGARESEGVQTLPLEDILPNPRQPRRNFSDKALEELAASIRSQGLLQPLLVRPAGPATPDKYEIVAGERRWRASRLAGLKEVPVLIRSLSAQDTLAAALIENLQREDLNPLEEALGLQTLKEEFGLSQDELAQKIGRSRSAIANSLRLLTLPESMRNLLAEGGLSSGHARALLSITEPKAQEALKNLILERHLSVRETEGLAAGWKTSGRFLLAGIDTDGLAEAGADVTAHKQEEGAAAADAAVPNPAAEGEKRVRPQSERILEIQNRIGQVLQVPVRVTGKENKGKISFSYNSKEELEAFLERLTGFVLEGANNAALPGGRWGALDSSGHDMLERMTREALDTAAHPELTGAERTALSGEERTHLAGAERQALRGSSSAALEQRDSASLEHRRQPVLDGAKNGVLAPAPDRQALAASSGDTPKATESADFSKSPLRRVAQKLSGAADGMRTDEAAADGASRTGERATDGNEITDEAIAAGGKPADGAPPVGGKPTDEAAAGGDKRTGESTAVDSKHTDEVAAAGARRPDGTDAKTAPNLSGAAAEAPAQAARASLTGTLKTPTSDKGE